MKDMEYGPHLIDETFDVSFRMQLTSQKTYYGVNLRRCVNT